MGLVQYPGCFVFDKFERSRKFYFRNCYILNIGMACSRQAAVNGISCLLCVAVVAFFAQVQSLYLWRHAFLSLTETMHRTENRTRWTPGPVLPLRSQ